MELELILLGLQALTPVVKALVAGHGVTEEQMRAILDFEAKAQAYAEQAAALKLAGDPAVAAAMARAHAANP